MSRADSWFVLDTLTKLDERHRNRVVIAGSHGGLFCGYLAAQGGLRGVILNDAGVGKDEAGISGLAYLDGLSMPAAAIDTMSARIGDGDDMAHRGIVSHVNASAALLGCREGQTAGECASRMLKAKPFCSSLAVQVEARHRIRNRRGEAEVWALDSASVVQPQDAGRILIIGSHGAAPGGRADMALQADAAAAVFHDAGVGIDKAGLSRLPFLDQRNLPAATVSAASARIGDGLSIWETGVLSHVNTAAAQLGGVPGMSVQSFVDLVTAPRPAET